MRRVGRTDLTNQLLGHGLDNADQKVLVDLFERWFVAARFVDQRRTLHDLLPAPQARS
jgi:hypothetical protein